MQLRQADFETIRILVREKSAIVLDSDKGYLVESRLAPLARREGFGSLDEMVSELRTRKLPTLTDKVVDAMTINETLFFRDVKPFECLQNLLPEMLRRRGAERQLNIWCAACSTGQEPYSMAMLFREQKCLPEGWRCRILASDLSASALARAQAARYQQLEVNRGLSASLLLKYFRKQGLEWQLCEDIRRAVDFQALNLIDPWPALPAMDIVFLRNVLIYFDVETKKSILARLRRVLRPDGYLFLGGAETTLNLDDAYERVPSERVSCYRLRSEQSTR